jgi:hypothetical protein
MADMDDRRIERGYEAACQYRWACEALYDLWEEIATGERDRGEPDVSWSLPRRVAAQLDRLDEALHVLCYVLDLEPIEDWSREEIADLFAAVAAIRQARDDDKASCARRPSP